ncbi:MAG: hypothetical protein ABI679_12590 [Gemmatimonadota bacterium]
MPSVSTAPERRTDLRVAFLPHARPRMMLADGVHDVLDAAPGGIRLRHADLVRPAVGELVSGEVHDPRSGEVHPVIGHISWVGSTAIGVMLDEMPLPVGFVMRELAWLRDQSEEPAVKPEPLVS